MDIGSPDYKPWCEPSSMSLWWCLICSNANSLFSSVQLILMTICDISSAGWRLTVDYFLLMSMCDVSGSSHLAVDVCVWFFWQLPKHEGQNMSIGFTALQTFVVVHPNWICFLSGKKRYIHDVLRKDGWLKVLASFLLCFHVELLGPIYCEILVYVTV